METLKKALKGHKNRLSVKKISAKKVSIFLSDAKTPIFRGTSLDVESDESKLYRGKIKNKEYICKFSPATDFSVKADEDLRAFMTRRKKDVPPSLTDFIDMATQLDIVSTVVECPIGVRKFFEGSNIGNRIQYFYDFVDNKDKLKKAKSLLKDVPNVNWLLPDLVLRVRKKNIKVSQSVRDEKEMGSVEIDFKANPRMKEIKAGLDILSSYSDNVKLFDNAILVQFSAPRGVSISNFFQERFPSARDGKKMKSSKKAEYIKFLSDAVKMIFLNIYILVKFFKVIHGDLNPGNILLFEPAKPRHVEFELESSKTISFDSCVECRFIDFSPTFVPTIKYSTDIFNTSIFLDPVIDTIDYIGYGIDEKIVDNIIEIEQKYGESAEHASIDDFLSEIFDAV